MSVPSGVGFGSIAAGHAVALDRGGHAWAWGTTEVTSLGQSNTATSPTPAAVSMAAGVAFAAISAGAQHSLALDRSGHAWAWGFNENRQLGDGTGRTRAGAVAVRMPAGVVFMAVAGTLCCSLALSRPG